MGHQDGGECSGIVVWSGDSGLSPVVVKWSHDSNIIYVQNSEIMQYPLGFE